jgi:hypothetical protein
LIIRKKKISSEYLKAGTPEKCGFQLNHNISIWTSPNLTSGSWTYAGNAINVTDRPAGFITYIFYFFNNHLHH